MTDLNLKYIRSKSLSTKLTALLSMFAKIQDFQHKDVQDELQSLINNGWKQNIEEIVKRNDEIPLDLREWIKSKLQEDRDLANVISNI